MCSTRFRRSPRKAPGSRSSIILPWTLLNVLGALAQFERDLIIARTSEGRARAKAAGQRFGRKPSLTAHQQAEARERRRRGETLMDLAASYGVSHSTISKLGE